MPPGTGVLVLVLVAAVLHASWNLFLKRSEDRLLTMAFLIGAGAIVSLPFGLVTGPPPVESWPFVAGSIALHTAYFVLLTYAYRHGDLGLVYPIARGTGPLLVAAAGGFVAGEHLGPAEWGGVLLVSTGLVAISLHRIPDRRPRLLPLGLAFATGLSIAAYTVNDGLGIRAAEEARVAYVAWIHILDAVPIVGAALLLPRERVRAFAATRGLASASAGLIATVAYVIVLFAMSRARLAHVAALRETSVILAAAMGTLVLGEPFGRRRLAAATAVATGVALIAL